MTPTIKSHSYIGLHDSFHEFMKHAYARLFLFFVFVGFVSLAFGIWAYVLISQPMGSTAAVLCDRISSNLKLFSFLLWVQAAVSLLLAFSLFKFNNCFHYLAVLVLLSFYLAVILVESAILVVVCSKKILFYI